MPIVPMLTISSSLPSDILPISENGAIIISARIDLENFWQKAINQSIESQLTFFQELVIDKHWLAYESLVSSDRNNVIERAKKWLSQMNPMMMEKTFETFRLFENEVSNQIEKFKQVFPDAKLNALVYLMISLRFDGKQSKIKGVNTTAFGIEHFVKDSSTVGTIISHEFTHLYQLEKGWSYRGNILQAAWEEGLATYTSGVLNSGSSEEKLLADSSLGVKCREDGKNIFATFLVERNENSSDSFTRWFSGSASNPDIPTRAGYYIGLIAVRHLSSTHSLLDMLSLPYDQVDAKMLAALNEIIISL